MYPRTHEAENLLVDYIVTGNDALRSVKVNAIATEPFNFTASHNGDDITHDTRAIPQTLLSSKDSFSSYK